MTKTKLAATVALVLALGLGGAAAWHFTRPTPTDLNADQAQSLLDDFDHQPSWEESTNRAGVGSASPAPVAKKSAAPVEVKHTPGTLTSVIRIPSIGLKYPIVEGTDTSDLRRGVGHYSATALAGQVGNYSLAGHVDGAAGDPFKHIGNLGAGDKVQIDTPAATYVYRVISGTACGPSQSIVHMSKIQVINPVPCSDASPTRRLLTMTTCAYPNGEKAPAIHRRIVWAELVTTTPRGE